MCDIYSNAFVTIAAAAARSDEEGFLKPDDTRLRTSALVFGSELEESPVLRRLRMKNYLGSGGYERFVNNAHLHGRGWVLQERALSRRILHFAEDQVYWQCRSVIERAADPNPEPLFRLATTGDGAASWRGLSLPEDLAYNVMDWPPPRIRRLTTDQHPGHGLQLRFTEIYLWKWDLLVRDYSRRGLTRPSDKLMAVSGLAERLSRIAEWEVEDCIAGHWRQALPSSLLWRLEADFKGPRNPAPSWSWASVNGPIEPYLSRSGAGKAAFGDHSAHRKVLGKIVKASTTPPPGLLQPFGSAAATHGCLTLQGQLCELRMTATSSGCKGEIDV